MIFRFARDRHLLDLDVDALIAGDLGFEQREDVQAHAQGCILCRRRVAEAREVYSARAPALRATANFSRAPRGHTAPTGASTGLAVPGSGLTAPPGTPVPRVRSALVRALEAAAAPVESGRSPVSALPGPAPAPAAHPTSTPPLASSAPAPVPSPRGAQSAIASAAAAAAATIVPRGGAATLAPVKRSWLLPAVGILAALLVLRVLFPGTESEPTAAPRDGVSLEVWRDAGNGRKEPLLDGATGRAGD